MTHSAFTDTLCDVLRRHAESDPERLAYTWLSDRGSPERSVSFGELARRATALAHTLRERAEPGERVLLLCPNGIDFMIGFFGSLLAGLIAVPMMLPRRQAARDASVSIVANCAPRIALAPAALIAGERGELTSRVAVSGLHWVAIDEPPPAPRAPLPVLQPNDIAFLQYTSGSTAAPKGVMVSHANLMANLVMIEAAFGNSRESTYVSWVPLYHDMGLITNALQAAYLGAHCVLMAPVAFIQRPAIWLRAISDYGAEVAGGPNFTFDLCVERARPDQLEGIDLSRWKVAFNGAEPVRAQTLRRFAEAFAAYGYAANTMYPAFGMAEGTVLITAGNRGRDPITRTISRGGLLRDRAVAATGAADALEVVACGHALPGENVAIVDPEDRLRCGPDEVGEIWVRGPNIAHGYWQAPEASEAVFAATIADDSSNQDWLRTGDLGFLDAAGELFITGRRKDMIIIRGANHYPQDIEDTVQNCHPGLRRYGGAAFAVSDAQGPERLVVVQEIERTYRNQIEPAELIRQIRTAIVNDHEIVPRAIELLRPGSLPKTTSGKIQRSLSRELWLAGALDRL
ncbi:MAG: fatty acyl-AMP ligase [Alphaproteobacteria bacterium]|nr:fatty acyl-AMP ligase [Alphaproteobacteria bacterium]